MKALTLTLLAALTLMSSASFAAHEGQKQLACGKWITDTGVRRDNVSTVYTPNRIAANSASGSSSDGVLRTK